MVIKLYVSNTSGNVLMKCHQDHIRRILDCKNIPYEMVDVADPHHKEEKLFMQGALQLKDEDLKALPPQIFNEKTHRGDYSTFFTAVECEALFGYLDLQCPPDEVEAQLQHGVLDILRPKDDEVTEVNTEYTEVNTEYTAHIQPSEINQQIARHQPSETAF